VISPSQRRLPDNTHNTHNRQTSMPPAGIFVLCTSSVLLLCPDCPGCAFCPYRATHTTRTSMPLAGFESAIPASDRPQTLALDRSATGIGTLLYLAKVKPAATVIKTRHCIKFFFELVNISCLLNNQYWCKNRKSTYYSVTIQRTELFLGQKVIYRMLFKKRKERNSVANSRDLATERS
jgi:hypothetical protein